MRKYSVEIDGQDYVYTEKQIINKLQQLNNTHVTELFIDDCVKGKEVNFSRNFLEELQAISNCHNSLNIANSINNQIFINQERG
jgi:hypothetical protein